MKTSKLIKKYVKEMTKLTDQALKAKHEAELSLIEDKVQIIRNYIDSLVDIKRTKALK